MAGFPTVPQDATGAPAFQGAAASDAKLEAIRALLAGQSSSLRGSLNTDRVSRVSTIGGASTYYSSVTGYSPYSTSPSDIAYMSSSQVSRRILVRQIRISATSDVAGVVDVTLKFAANAGAGTTVPPSKADVSQGSQVGYLATWSAAPTLGASRTDVAAGKLLVGTSTTLGNELVFEFGSNEKPPTIRDYNQFLVMSVGGATLPGSSAAAIRFNISVRWVEEPVTRVLVSGDSTTSNATNLFASIATLPGLVATTDVQPFGNNGKRLLDLLPATSSIGTPNLSGLNYTQGLIATSIPALGASWADQRVVLCWGINDVRQGATTQPQLIDLLDAEIYAILNGTVSGQTYTAARAGGAGTTFTWNQTIPARPNAKIYLWGPNSLLADDPTGANGVTMTNAFAGMTLAVAAQTATNILYNAYQAFVGDPRIVGVWQKQTYVSPTLGIGFTQVSRPGASSPLMKDGLHPGTNGEFVEAEQLVEMMGWTR